MRTTPTAQRIMRHGRSGIVGSSVGEPLSVKPISVEVMRGEMTPAEMPGRVTPSTIMPGEMPTKMVAEVAAVEAPEMSKAAKAVKAAAKTVKATAKAMKTAPAETVKAPAEAVKAAAPAVESAAAAVESSAAAPKGQASLIIPGATPGAKEVSSTNPKAIAATMTFAHLRVMTPYSRAPAP